MCVGKFLRAESPCRRVLAEQVEGALRNSRFACTGFAGDQHYPVLFEQGQQLGRKRGAGQSQRRRTRSQSKVYAAGHDRGMIP